MVAAAELEPGRPYEIVGGPSGQPRGRAIHVAMLNIRTAIMRFPDSGSPAREWRVNTAAIAGRWDDPGLVEQRRQIAEHATRAAEARAVLAALGLDVQQPGRTATRGPAQVVVGPSVGRWSVSIELGAFCRLVAPALRFALAEHTEEP